MDSVSYLVVGAGVSGLSFANAIHEEASLAGALSPEVLVLEADREPGGYCKTIEQDGFVWDYSGHFFHFRHAKIEQWLRERMVGQDIRTVTKCTKIRYKGRDIDFPFQKNIHQLMRKDFIDCLVSLYFRDEGCADRGPSRSFKDMLYHRFGSGISERFLIPYNEKLYACDLDTLDVDAMGRFFPHADIDDVIRNMKTSDNRSYNSTFIYPAGGAIQFIRALLQDLPDGTISLGERLVSVDVESRVAHTSSRSIRYQHLVTSAPFDALCAMANRPVDAQVFTSNKVLVFNLGFDSKGPPEMHWMYFPEGHVPFYRVGFYDNIMAAERMSLYVEIGAKREATLDVKEMKKQVLEGLRKEGIVTSQKLVGWHSIVMNPAYVHITERSIAEHQRLKTEFAEHGVHPVGRYGGWTYCSIEDNIVETRALAKALFGSKGRGADKQI